MIISIASGKGGTGKTTVAVNLALTLRTGATYVDCDVEEPNGHLFLKPSIDSRRSVGIPVPVVDRQKCTGCGRCSQVCRYNAIACVRGKVLVFKDLCHGCGGCLLTCPVGAITETEYEIGCVEIGRTNGIGFIQGRLNVGVAMSPPLIRAVKSEVPADGVSIVDAPPGAACPVITAVRESDYVVLVTEPTPFGLHDLTIAVETIKVMGIPFGVLVNRCDVGDRRVLDYCRKNKISVLSEIPDDRRIAEAYSHGQIIIDAVPDYRPIFAQLAGRVHEELKLAQNHIGKAC